MSLGDAIAFGSRESSIDGGIITVDTIGETREFGDMKGFYDLEPLMQGVRLALFEHGDKFLTQNIGRVEV